MDAATCARITESETKRGLQPDSKDAAGANAGGTCSKSNATFTRVHKPLTRRSADARRLAAFTLNTTGWGTISRISELNIMTLEFIGVTVMGNQTLGERPITSPERGDKGPFATGKLNVKFME